MVKRKYLSRAEILAVEDLPVEEHYVEEWGTWVRVQAMNALRASQFADTLEQDDHLVTAKLVVFSAVDEQNMLLFMPEDAPALAAKHSNAMRTLGNAARRLSRMGKDEQEAQAVRNEANFTAAASAGSLSD